MNTVAIVNPKAGTGKPVPFPEGIEILETEEPGHGTALTREAIKAGAQTIIAVGGDGTINEVVNGFFENQEVISARAVLAIVPRGTGSDFRRSLNLPLDSLNALAMTHSGTPRPIDVMKVRYTATDGMPELRYSVNVISFGMGAEVAARVKRLPKLLGPRMAFAVATLQSACLFSGKNIMLQMDDSVRVTAKITNVAIGNGQYHGAGMRICPEAKLDDGLLDLTLIRTLNIAELVKGFRVLYNGTIHKHPKVESYRAQHIKAESPEQVLVEIDGEPLGQLPIEISILPKAIQVWAP